MIRTRPIAINNWSVRTAPPRVVGPGLLLKARCCPLAARLTYGPPGGGPFLSRPATLPGAYSADTVNPHMFATGFVPSSSEPDLSSARCRATGRKRGFLWAACPQKTAPVRKHAARRGHGVDVATLSQRGRGEGEERLFLSHPLNPLCRSSDHLLHQRLRPRRQIGGSEIVHQFLETVGPAPPHGSQPLGLVVSPTLNGCLELQLGGSAQHMEQARLQRFRQLG